MGAETGDDEILEYIHKGVTAGEVIAAGQKLKRCGIATSVTLISGLGGRKKVKEHALSCAKLITEMNPEYASFLTLRLYEGTPMYEDVVEGRFERITADEIMDEMKIFLEMWIHRERYSVRTMRQIMSFWRERLMKISPK